MPRNNFIRKKFHSIYHITAQVLTTDANASVFDFKRHRVYSTYNSQ